MRVRAAFVLASFASLAAPLAAQSTWSIDPSGNMSQWNGPAGGPCSYPLGPVLSFWGHVTTGPCSTPGTVGANGVGGLGIDRQADELWITDGFTASGYQTFSTPVVTGVDVAGLLGAPVTGIDWDPAIGGVWVTDGTSAISAQIVFNGSCYDAVAIGTSFALPLAPGANALALSHDPVSNALWVSDNTGMLTHVTKTGTLGPFGSVHVASASGCALGDDLTGVAADPAGPVGRVYVTDGFTMSVVDMTSGGTAAPTTFYTNSSCFPTISAPNEGLAIAATGNLYGSPSPSVFPYPVIGTRGQSVVPNPNFAIEIGAAIEDELAILILGGSDLCPEASVLGIPLHVAPPLTTVATVVIGETGFASVPLPLGVPTPIGETVFVQWGVIDPVTLGTTASRGLALTTSLP